jgi:hypothetical protein
MPLRKGMQGHFEELWKYIYEYHSPSWTMLWVDPFVGLTSSTFNRRA